VISMISGFGRDTDKICALLEYNATSSDNPLPTFRENVLVPSSRVKKSIFLEFLTLGDGTDRFSRNVGKGLTFNAALYPRRAQISLYDIVQHISLSGSVLNVMV
jgi:hypothetical protein